eukprot:6491267-Amphidinium_carterae.2
MKESTQVRSTSLGKRSAAEVIAPPGLEEEESEAKTRKTMMIHSVNLQQQVVMLQSVVQRFEVTVNCDMSQEWLQGVWNSIGEIAGHLHEVARFVVQGFDHQWMQHQGLQQIVEQMSVAHQGLQQTIEQMSADVKSCWTFATRVARNEDAMTR